VELVFDASLVRSNRNMARPSHKTCSGRSEINHGSFLSLRENYAKATRAASHIISN
jgi:hypothetical protein